MISLVVRIVVWSRHVLGAVKMMTMMTVTFGMMIGMMDMFGRRSSRVRTRKDRGNNFATTRNH